MATQEACEQEIRYLELEIQDWPRTQSQSNPSAMFELRHMKKELERYKKLRNEFREEENRFILEMMMTCPMKSICSLCEPKHYTVVAKKHRVHASLIQEYTERMQKESKQSLLNELEGLIIPARKELQDLGGCPACVDDSLNFETWMDMLEYAHSKLDVYAYLYQQIHELPFTP